MQSNLPGYESKTGVSVAPQKGLISSKKLKIILKSNNGFISQARSVNELEDSL